MWSPAERRLQQLLNNMMLADMPGTMLDSPFASTHFTSAFFDPVSVLPAGGHDDDDDEQLRQAVAASVTDTAADADSALLRALAESSKQYSEQRGGDSSEDEQWVIDAADLHLSDASTPSQQPAPLHTTEIIADGNNNDSDNNVNNDNDDDDDALLQHAIALSQENARPAAAVMPSVASARQTLSELRAGDHECLEQALQSARSSANTSAGSMRPPVVDAKEAERRQTVLEQNAELERAIDVDRARLAMDRSIERAKLERQSQLAAVVAAQLPAEPAPEPGRTCTIAVRLPNSSRIERTWSLDTPLHSVATWAAAALIASGRPVLPTEFHLVTGFPHPRKLVDTASTLDELGVCGRVLLTVDLCAD